MPEVCLDIGLPDHCWSHELTTRFGDATLHVHSAVGTDSGGVMLAEITAGGISSLLAELPAYDEVTAVDVLTRTDESAMVQCDTTDIPVHDPLQAAGVPVEMPYQLENGTAHFVLRTSEDRLSTLGSELEAAGYSYTIDSLQTDLEQSGLLTESQEVTVGRAIEMGYYDMPRESSLTDLADDIDRAKSTVSETMQRAEGKIIKAYQASRDDD